MQVDDQLVREFAQADAELKEALQILEAAQLSMQMAGQRKAEIANHLMNEITDSWREQELDHAQRERDREAQAEADKTGEPVLVEDLPVTGGG